MNGKVPEQETGMWTPSYELELCHKPGIWATLSLSKRPKNRRLKLKFSNFLFNLYFQASDTVGLLDVFSVMVVEEDTIIHRLLYFPSPSSINVAEIKSGRGGYLPFLPVGMFNYLQTSETRQLLWNPPYPNGTLDKH